MPLEKVLPFVGIGSDLLTTGANAMMNAANNRQQRAFAREMYRVQRTDSLSDWNMQNFYNSPAQQMARLKAAGLNPNLVYGNGATATSPSMPRSSSGSTPSTNPTRVDSPNFMGVYDLQLRKADMDMKREAILNMQKDRQKKDADILETMSRVPGYGLKQALDSYNLEWLKTTDQLRKDQLSSGIDQTKANTLYTLSQNERAAAMQAYSLQEAYERILTMRIGRTATQVQMKKTGVETDLAEEDLKLRKQGIYPGDPLWLRTLVNKLDNVDIPNPIKSIKGYLEERQNKKSSYQKFHQKLSPFPWMK